MVRFNFRNWFRRLARPTVRSQQTRLALEELGRRDLLAVSVFGTVFHDVNGDGVIQDDAGLPGRTVYVDVDGNRSFDGDEPSAVSGDDGQYVIEDVPPGVHEVLMDRPDEWLPSVPFFGIHTIDAGEEGEMEGIDFGATHHLRNWGEFGNDVIVLRDQGDNPDAFELLVNGQVQRAGLWSSVDSVMLFGWGGDDLIRIESSTYADLQIPITALGLDGNDTLVGGVGKEALWGGRGDDEIWGNEGDDFLVGDDDQDTVHGGSGADVLFGGTGHDLLEGDEDNDTIYGETGHDRLIGGADDDVLGGGEGDDHLLTGGGVDRLVGEGGNDHLEVQESGSDCTLIGGSGDDYLLGGDGKDEMHGEAGDDTLIGGEGDDVVDGGADDDSLLGGDGTDLLRGSDGHDILKGGDENDTLQGGNGDDVVDGDEGDDHLEGGGGNDELIGRDGNDRLEGNHGDDQFWGDEGDDTILGGVGNDSILGGDGDDRVLCDDGNDTVQGGLGNDSILGHAGSDQLDGDAGDDVIYGDEGHDALIGREGNDSIIAGPGNDSLYGDDGDDSLHGGLGNDFIRGDAGIDTLGGGLGRDTVHGSLLDDTFQLDGGAGTPAYVGTHIIDVNRDGRNDAVAVANDFGGGLLISTFLMGSNGVLTPVQQNLGDRYTLAPVIGDVNGDGRLDLIFPYEDPVKGLIVRTKLSNGNGTWTSRPEQVLGDRPDQSPVVGDFNGDRRADLLYHTYDDSRGLILRTKFANSNGTWTPREQVLGDDVMIGPLVADVNGDRKADLVFHEYDLDKGLIVRTKFSNGNGTWKSVQQVLGDDVMLPPLAGDVNGDGKADLVFHYYDSAKGLVVRTKLSKGNGTWTAKQQVLGDGMLSEPTLADVNRDRRVDLVFTYFDPLKGWRKRVKLSKGDGTWTAQPEVPA